MRFIKYAALAAVAAGLLMFLMSPIKLALIALGMFGVGVVVAIVSNELDMVFRKK